MFETAIEKNISILLDSGFKVTLRPHPMTQKKSEKKINFLNQKFSSNSNFILEKNIPNFDSFMKSDIMITDWSGAAIEYAFTLERPVLFIDVPKKIHNPDYEKLPEIPLEISIRDKIGEIISLSDIQLLPEKIQSLCQNPDIIKGKIQKIRGELISNLGNSSKLEVRIYIKIKKPIKKMKGKKIVYVGMVGDFLHHGHINIIEEARKLGEVTIGLLTDEAAESYKRKPIFTFEQRKKIIENIKGVTFVIPQNSLDYIPNLKKIKPNYVVHGDDWKSGGQKDERRKIINYLKEINGTLVEIPYTPGISSTSIIQRLRED